MAAGAGRDDCKEWTEDEWAWFDMGPFDGGIPGLVRRVRRILDVSQRGLAAILEVSQSVVARWESGRVSPRASVLQRLLGLAGLKAVIHDEDGAEVTPMRGDGARDRGGRRYPAHVDLTVRGWWTPPGAALTAFYPAWVQRSRERRDPRISYTTCAWRRSVQRLLFGTPDDHPAVFQLAAEAEHLDEVRATRRAPAGQGSVGPPALRPHTPRSA
jgi:HTH-type transcriptional regulator/antitoxin HipB